MAKNFSYNVKKFVSAIDLISQSKELLIEKKKIYDIITLRLKMSMLQMIKISAIIDNCINYIKYINGD